MNPIKVRTILPTIAVEHKEDLELLQRLNSSYWDKIRLTLSTTNEGVVEVINLGRFYRKYNYLLTLKRRLINYIAKINISIAGKTQAEQDLIYVNNAIDFVEEEKTRRSIKKTIKDEYKRSVVKKI